MRPLVALVPVAALVGLVVLATPLAGPDLDDTLSLQLSHHVQQLLTAVVERAEKVGKQVKAVVVFHAPTGGPTDPASAVRSFAAHPGEWFACAQHAARLTTQKLIVGWLAQPVEKGFRISPCSTRQSASRPT